jgi:hypothetical protein
MPMGSAASGTIAFPTRKAGDRDWAQTYNKARHASHASQRAPPRLEVRRGEGAAQADTQRKRQGVAFASGKWQGCL